MSIEFLTMSGKHPTREILEKFLEGRLSPAESWEVVRHLLSGCESCKELAGRLWFAGEGPGEVEFDRIKRDLVAFEVTVQRERARAPNLLSEIRRHPPSRQRLLVLNSRTFQTFPLCDLILKEAFDTGFQDPRSAVELAQLGVDIASVLDADRYGATFVKDAQARAFGVLANAQRLISDFRGANKTLRMAEAALSEGSGDPLEDARIKVFQGYLAHESREFDLAVSLFKKAQRTFRRLGESHLEGCAVIDQGTCLVEAERSAEAIPLLKRGLELVDPAREPRRVLAAKHNLIFSLHACGRFGESQKLLEEVRSLHSELANRVDLLRLRWLEARIAGSQEMLDSAEAAYSELRDAFVELELPFDAALVSLDLAKVYLEQGRYSEIRSLASEVLTIFRSLGVHREALAAVALFQQAAEQERVSLAWLSSLAGYLDKAQSNPTLRFRPA